MTVMKTHFPSFSIRKQMSTSTEMAGAVHDREKAVEDVAVNRLIAVAARITKTAPSLDAFKLIINDRSQRSSLIVPSLASQ